jgi:hypothetical protein
MPKAAGDCNNRTTAVVNRRSGAFGPSNAAGGPEGTGPDRPHHDVDRKTPIRAQVEPVDLLLRTRHLAAERVVISRHSGRMKATLMHFTARPLQKS